MRDFTKTRSSGYQNFFAEIPCENSTITNISDSASIGGRLNHKVYNEELYDLQEQLRLAYWRIIDNLTKRQREVLRMLADGKTQMEVAKVLKVNQSSITKSLNGNTDYRNNGKKVYGGSRKRLRKIASKDPEIQEILKKIAEISDE